jgi:hypothetical protein
MKEAFDDKRNISRGWEIPKEHYCDQPYIVVTKDNSWVCVMTTGNGIEGEPGQHVVSTISRDQGRTWSELIDIEPSDGPEASWVMPLIVPSGRIYAFYTYNKDNIREITGGYFDGRPGEQRIKRVDTLGYMAYKFSDDHGMSWSEERYYIPIRNFDIDLRNRHQGNVQYFWGVGKPIVHDGSVYIGFAKVGDFGPGFMAESEGAFLKSTNILEEKDPDRINWETLPDGAIGLRAPLGKVADEHNPVGLNDGSLYCTYRTVEGHNAHAYSRDGGQSWTAPEHATYTPGGRKLKHPRAANFVKKFSNGHYLLWYHNHGRSHIEEPWKAYQDRNPVWISGGVERDGYIYWSQPEILLYDDVPTMRMSYPDFIEQDGAYYVTETQKEMARVHPIDPALLDGLWKQNEHAEVTLKGLATCWRSDQGGATEKKLELPKLLSFKDGGGFTLDLWIRFDSISAGQIVLDSRDGSGIGLVLRTTDRGTIELVMSDGRTQASWDCDAGVLKQHEAQHIAVIVDGGPKLITFVVDGQLNDGGQLRQFGWGRFAPDMREINGLMEADIAVNLQGELISLRVYDRYLRTSEAVGNYRAGFDA